MTDAASQWPRSSPPLLPRALGLGLTRWPDKRGRPKWLLVLSYSYHLALSCPGPQARQACAKGASPQLKMVPGEREHTDPKEHAGPSAATRPVQ